MILCPQAIVENVILMDTFSIFKFNELVYIINLRIISTKIFSLSLHH